MFIIKEVDLAWAAGFFEGEGYVQCVQRKNKKRAKDRHFAISVAQVHRQPLDKLQDLFEGNVNGPYGPYATTKQPYYTYNLYGDKAIRAVKLMLPYLFRKGEQVQIALDQWEQHIAERE